MLDRSTIVPTYDGRRGEPRARLRRTDEGTRTTGDCIDCNQCVAVCPTGVDIRRGQQEGCITCALCIDACDQVMDKIGRPRGLIRYASLDELEGRSTRGLWLRPRIWVYVLILGLSLFGILHGLTALDPLELRVLHERAPLFVLQSDGSIQNKYTLKILNKTHEPLAVRIRAKGHDDLRLVGAEPPIEARPGGVTPATVFVRIPREALEAEQQPIVFRIEAERATGELAVTERESVFVGPEPRSD
jgi:Polyferredoxin